MFIQFKGIYGTHHTIMEIKDRRIHALLSHSDIVDGKVNGEPVIVKDGYAYPAFNDSHMHFIGYGLMLSQLFFGNCHSIQDMVTKIEEEQKSFSHNRGNQWLRGRGWNHDNFSEQRLPNRHDLDSLPTIPMAFERTCGHIALLNTSALLDCGLLIMKDGKEEINTNLLDKIRKTGGDVDIQNGELTGIIRENALSLIPKEYSDAQLEDYIIKAQEKLLSYGIGSVQTDDLYFHKDPFHIIDLFEKMEQEGKLKIRIYQQSQIANKEDILNKYKQDKSGGDKLFKCGPIKIIADGSLGSRTAYVKEPYHDDKNNRGMLILSADALSSKMIAASQASADSAVHGIGDAAIEIILDINKNIYTLTGKTNRNTIVHSQIMSMDQINQMANLKMGALVQPIFLDYDSKIVEARVGKELASTSYAYRTMLDKGIVLAFGSDAPVENPNPLLGMHHAINRTFLPHEAISLKEAIKCYTENGAYYSYEENNKGRLDVGQFADLCVTKEELTSDNLLTNSVISTYVGGTCVWTKEY